MSGAGGRVILTIGSTSSKCGKCGRNADPSEKAHTMETMRGEGCGAVYTHVAAQYPGTERRVASMRPDLTPTFTLPDHDGCDCTEPTSPVPAPDAGLTEALARALGEHVLTRAPITGAWSCSCGAESTPYERGDDYPTVRARRAQEWVRHQAEALAPVVAEHVAGEQAAAWDEGFVAACDEFSIDVAHAETINPHWQTVADREAGGDRG